MFVDKICIKWLSTHQYHEAVKNYHSEGVNRHGYNPNNDKMITTRDIYTTMPTSAKICDSTKVETKKE